MLQQIIEAGERSARLTQQLLAFSRKQVLAPTVLDLNEVLVGAETLLRRIIGEDIHLVTAPQAGIGKVKTDQGQLEQVLINLVVNARDAMPQGGKLTIETANAELDKEYVKLHPYIEPGSYIMLAVTDSGTGMTREVQQRIFEPFFTTKEPGKGTGLGLAMAYGVVKQSGGSIEVYSEPGMGTSFKIYLPRAEDPAIGAVPNLPKVQTPRGTATILLVEDEAALRALAFEILRERGYQVLESGSSAEALKIAASHPAIIHLLLTDVIMPGMGGRLLAEQLVATRPEMKVLYMSGYTDDAVMRHGILHEQVNFLRKPFSTTALAQKVWDVLHPS